jgi:hypothetical protein
MAGRQSTFPLRPMRAMVAAAVEGDEIGMAHRQHRLDGADEAMQIFLVLGKFGQVHLQRDLAAFLDVGGAKDETRVADRDDGVDVVMAELRIGELAKFGGIGDRFVLVARQVHVEAQLRAAEVDDVAVHERLFAADAFAVDLGSRFAAHVAQERGLEGVFDAAMGARDRRIHQLDVGAIPTTDGDFQTLGERIDLTLIGPGDNHQLRRHRPLPWISHRAHTGHTEDITVYRYIRLSLNCTGGM